VETLVVVEVVHAASRSAARQIRMRRRLMSAAS
jgi:hypothetical protein